MKYPDPPYYYLNKDGRGDLALGTDGSFEECEKILAIICDKFSARAEKHMEAGPNPNFGKTVDGAHWDKEHGYWYIYVGRKRFFLMRFRGDGIWIHCDAEGDPLIFQDIAKLFDAVEFIPWYRRMFRFLGINA